MFAAALFFARQPRIGAEPELNNGTMSLLNLEQRQIGITCFHVLEAYHKKREQDLTVDCYLGLLCLDLLPRIIDQDRKLDLITFDLSGVNLRHVSDHPQIGSNFFFPPVWPCTEVQEGDFVTFGGFPGLLRAPLNFRDVEFRSFSYVGCRVTSVHEEYIVCQFEREYEVPPINLGSPLKELPDISHMDLGGLSGGPVFIWRQLHWEFVGIMYQYSAEFELLYIRPAKLISTDGRINRAAM